MATAKKPAKKSASKAKTSAANKAAKATKKPKVTAMKAAAKPKANKAKAPQAKKATAKKAFNFAPKNVEQISKYTNTLSNGAIESGKEQVGALMESSKRATDIGKNLQEDMTRELSALFSENVALSQELLACRNVQDMMSIQSRMASQNMTRMFEQSRKISEMWMKMATDISEPLGEQANQAVNRFSKALSA